MNVIVIPTIIGACAGRAGGRFPTIFAVGESKATAIVMGVA